MTLVKQYNSIQSRSDFLAFVRALREDLIRDPGGWENNTLDLFLKAFGDWVEDMDGFYLNRGKVVPEPEWKIVADMLMGARVYE